MAVNTEIWVGELCEKIKEMDMSQIEELVRTLENKYLVDKGMSAVVPGMSRQKIAETIESVGKKIASDPAALKSFLDAVKQLLPSHLLKLYQLSDFESTQTLNALDPGSISPSYGLQSTAMVPVHMLNAPRARPEAFVTEATGVKIPPNIYYPVNSASPDSHMMPHPTEENEMLQGIPPNDSGLVLDLTDSETGMFNSSSKFMVPQVQRSFSGTSDSSDSSQLEGIPSPVRQKFQKMKNENRDLRKQNLDLTEENQELKRELKGMQNAPVQVPLSTLSHQSADMSQDGEEKFSFLTHSECDDEVLSHLSLQYPVQEELAEIPDNIPKEVQEYIEKLRKDREFMKQRAVKAEEERDILKKWIIAIMSHYERKLYEVKRESIRMEHRYKEIKKPDEEKAEIEQLKWKEQELEQQRRAVVMMALQNYIPPPKGEFDWHYYLTRNNEECQVTKCQICLRQLGKNQEFCQTCLPGKINQKEHNKLKLHHKFQTLNTTRSHVYSQRVLVAACKGNYECILLANRTPPKFITPQAFSLCLYECISCDTSTTNLENSFLERYRKYYHAVDGSQPSLVGSDAVLFYIYIHRGLAVNVNLMHYVDCSHCTQYLPHIKNVLQLAWKFRRIIYLNQADKKRQDDKDMQSKAMENLLFHTVDSNEKYLIELPFVCNVDSCALIYAQIPPCCWAVPLDPSSPALPVLRENFPDVVKRINCKLSVEHEQSLKSIGMEGTSHELIVKYLPECCLSVD